MGLLTDFIVASPNDALNYASFISAGEVVPRERFERCEYKNYTDLALGQLWAILSNEQQDAKRHALEAVRIGEQGETWLFRFPDAFVGLIADLEQAAIKTTAQTWSESEEVPGGVDDNEPTLTDLIRLAKYAQSSGRSLYLWGSL
jgi:hypothetical protein